MYDREHLWLSSRPSDIAHFIEEVDGRGTNNNMALAGALLRSALIECADRYPDLYEVGRLFARLREVFADHLAEEIRGLLKLPEQPHVPAGLLTVWRSFLAEEHGELRRLLASLRATTFDYTVAPRPTPRSDGFADPHGEQLSAGEMPASAGGVGSDCRGRLFSVLRELDVDIHRHIYMQEQRLLPLLEQEVAAAEPERGAAQAASGRRGGLRPGLSRRWREQ